MTAHVEEGLVPAPQLGSMLSEEDVTRADTATLRRHLAGAVSLTAVTLRYLALVWRELEGRGEDLSGLRTGLSIYLPQIAQGRLDPAFVVRYAGQRMLIAAAARLPVAEQQRLALEGTVPVAPESFEGIGDVVASALPLHHMTASDIRLVFADDRVRTPLEQAALRAKDAARRGGAASKSPRAARQVKVSEDGKALLVGGQRAHLDRVLEALSEHYGFDVKEIVKKRATSEKALRQSFK